jgi:hypothetical protein
MPDFIESVLIALIPSIIVAVFAAYLSARLTLKEFYRQKWWERKLEAYSKILEHLSFLQYHTTETINDYQANIPIDDELQDRLTKGYKKSKEALIKTAAIGEFIVSERTTQALSKLIIKMDNLYFEEDFGKVLEENDKAQVECIEIVRAEAKKTLSK